MALDEDKIERDDVAVPPRGCGVEELLAECDGGVIDGEKVILDMALGGREVESFELLALLYFQMNVPEEVPEAEMRCASIVQEGGFFVDRVSEVFWDSGLEEEGQDFTLLPVDDSVDASAG